MKNLKNRLKSLLQTIIDFEENDFTENEDINLIEEDQELYESIKGIAEKPLSNKEYFDRIAKYDHLYADAVILYANLKNIQVKKATKRK